MHSLSPLTALGGTEPCIDVFEGLVIADISDVALASLALRFGKETAFAQACKQATGSAPPLPGCFSSSGVMTVFAMGLDQWMVTAPIKTHEDLAAQLAMALKDTASITEQTDGWVWFDVSGVKGPAMFERLCAANIRAMVAGAVTRTAIDHLGCFVMCRKAKREFSVIGPRSSAKSLHHAMITAAHSVL